MRSVSSTGMILLLTSVTVCTVACPDGPPDPPPCEENFVGDRNAEVELEIVHRSAIGQLVEATEGGDVELFRPPQGGKVFLTAARVKNVDQCGLTIQGALRDPENGRIIGNELRTFNSVVTEDGWIAPLSATSLSSWANVPVCPSRAITRPVLNQEYELIIRVEDRAGRTAEKTMMVVPRCVQPGFLGEQCRCECTPNYTLGDVCYDDDAGMPEDGGMPADGGADEDAGVPNDAGMSLIDAGLDAGQSPMDAGAEDAGGSSSDAGAIDAGHLFDAGQSSGATDAGAQDASASD